MGRDYMSFALFYNYTISVYYWIPYVMHDFMNIQVKIMGNMANSMSKSKKTHHSVKNTQKSLVIRIFLCNFAP